MRSSTARFPSTKADANLASMLRVAVMRLRRRLNVQRAADHLLSANQLGAMGTLKVHGPMTLGELAAHERVRPPSMTRTVTSMEALGLVVREPHPTDRRQVMVRLADEGKRILEDDRRRRDAWLARRLARLTSEEKDVLRRAVPILSALAQSDEPDGTPGPPRPVQPGPAQPGTRQTGTQQTGIQQTGAHQGSRKD